MCGARLCSQELSDSTWEADAKGILPTHKPIPMFSLGLDEQTLTSRVTANESFSKCNQSVSTQSTFHFTRILHNQLKIQHPGLREPSCPATQNQMGLHGAVFFRTCLHSLPCVEGDRGMYNPRRNVQSQVEQCWDGLMLNKCIFLIF